MSDIRGVLFDMDGLLFDSERIGVEVTLQAGLEQGVTLSREIIHLTLGVTLKRCEEIYHEHYPAIDEKKLRAAFDTRMREIAREGKMPLKKGARELLAYLKGAGIPCAVASSSGQITVELYLRSQGILDDFQVLVCGDQITHSKPHPEIFHRAAEALGLKNEDCLVLEDSYNGVRAGRASGSITGMVPDIIPFAAPFAPYVDQVFPSLNDVIPYLEKP